MKRQNVQEAYKRIRPTQEEKDVMLLHILSAASEQPPARKDIIMKRRKMKPVMIAAIVALMVLLMGCAVVLFTLQDIKIGEYSYTEPRYMDENGKKISETEKAKDVISLQGIAGSPEQMAAQEWYEFEQEYWKNNASKIEDDFQKPEDYKAYSVGNQEMVDKVDEIAEKYGLKLAGPVAVTQTYEQDIFFVALGLDGLTKPDADITLEDGSGYFYECGNFNLEFWFTMNGEESQWPHELLVSYNYKNKGYFDTVFSTVEDINSVTQWNYTLADGTKVLIVNTGGTAGIFCDREDAFLSASFGVTYGNEVMSNRDIELAAEALDFTVKPQKPDMKEVKKKLEESYRNYLTKQDAMLENWVDPWVQDSYADYIKYLLDSTEDPGNVTYARADVNGDGVEELLIGYLTVAKHLGGDEDCFIEVLTMKDGKTSYFFTTSSPTYLCDGYALECIENTKDREWHGYYTLGSSYAPEEMTGKVEFITFEKYDEVWKYSDFSDTEGSVISEQEAKKIMDSYTRIPLDMKPITEFPMD